jgi:bacteriocin biosynthesis cyclodehydratase domain-containing protein
VTQGTVQHDGRRPALAPWYRLVQEPDRLLLEHAGSLVALEGRAAGLLLPPLLPLLDGTRTVEQIVAALGPAIRPSIEHALELLDSHGLLVDGRLEPPNADPGTVEAARFATAGAAGAPSPAEALARLARGRLGVCGSAAAAGEVARLIGAAGVGVRREPLERLRDDLDLLVAAPDRSETALLRSVNERALAERRPWLQVVPYDGRIALVGPLFLPGDTACHECYRMRRAASSDYEDDFPLLDGSSIRAAAPAALAAVTGGLAALVAIRWLATGDPAIPGRAYCVSTRPVFELTCHHVLRVPRCSVCGTVPAALPSPWFKETAGDA